MSETYDTRRLAEIAAVNLGDARAAYHRAYRAYSDSLPPLDLERFWIIAGVLRREVEQQCLSLGRTNGVPLAVEELFRKPLARDFHDRRGPRHVFPEYSLEEAMRLSSKWREVSSSLYDPLFDVVEGRGDDSYGDLLDALPLAGRDVVDRAAAGGYADNDAFESACVAELGPRFSRLVLQGEHYIGATLEESAADAFVQGSLHDASR